MTRKLPQPISKEDFDKVLEVLKKERDTYWRPRKMEYTPFGEKLQDFVIAICLGFGAGLRISEICGLEKKQKYKGGFLITSIPRLTKDRIENNLIRIVGAKGQKDRTVPLPMKTFRRAGITRIELERRLPLKTSYRTIQTLITRYGKKVLYKHITFHTLRHGFVTHALNSGMPIHQVQAFAGHSRMDTTGLYTHINPKEALDKYQELDF